MRFLIFFLFLAMLPTAAAQSAPQVGISPTVLDLGNLSPGSAKFTTLTLISESSDDILVQLTKNPIDSTFFGGHMGTILYPNSSEEPILPWIEFFENPVTLTTLDNTIVVGSARIKRAAETNILVTVPEDSEPGYHIAYIHAAPKVIPTGGSQAIIIAAAQIPLMFNVPGDVVREGQIIDIVAGTLTDAGVPINIYFKNTGTVTIQARATELVVSDTETRFEGTSTFMFVPPGKTVALEASAPSGVLSVGTYDVYAYVSYGTGEDAMETTLFVEAPGPLSQPTPLFLGIEAIEGVPLWIILLLVLIAILIYLHRRVQEF
ncbi:MAG: hypothetical protein KKA90_05050 [Nanoarchaeota archaeon]|nr:hypothetical protein [Nanoarchaeota archaeon]